MAGHLVGLMVVLMDLRKVGEKVDSKVELMVEKKVAWTVEMLDATRVV